MKDMYSIFPEQSQEIDPAIHKIIVAIYEEYQGIFLFIAASQISKADRLDAIHSFIIDKLYRMDIEKLKDLQAKGPQYIKKAFKNFIIDNGRSSQRRQSIADRLIERGIIENQIDSIDMNDRMNDLITKCRDLIGQRWKDDDDAIKIFELHIQNFKNEEIAEIIQKTPASIASKKSRILNFIRNNAASLL